MLFRRRSRSRDAPTAESTPAKDAKDHAPKTLEEIIALSKSLPDDRHKATGSSDESNRSYNSSPDRSREYREERFPKRTATSRKTGFATIRTDSTDTHAAFESDAFAVLMPTTRLPIIDCPVSPTRVAAQAARAEALKAYQEKARQERERNNSQSVKVPSKIVSYDYASRHVAVQLTTPELLVEPPTPAGSFPVSPPLSQHTWSRPTQTVKTEVRETRHVQGLSNITPPRKTAAASTSSVTPATPSSCYRVYRIDSTAGASRSSPSPTPLPPSIKVRIKPKPVVNEQERVQAESRYSLYNRSLANSSTRTSRDSSPVKSMPNFTASNSVEGDSIFGYRTKDPTRNVAGAAPPPNNDKQEKVRLDREAALERARAKIAERERARAMTAEKERAKKASPKRTLTTRWPWLRPSGPPIEKPNPTPLVSSMPAEKEIPSPAPTKRYIDPFATLSPPTPTPLPTPQNLRAASSKKPTSTPTTNIPSRLIISTPIPPATGTFDTGFAQIKSFTLTILKLALILYAIIALWFVLDAVREAFNTLATPFRAIRWIGEGVWDVGVWMWDGVRVVMRRWR